LDANKFAGSFPGKAALTARLGDVLNNRKTQANGAMSRQLAFSTPYPLPYPPAAGITKASAKTNALFALYRGFDRIVYRANRLT
jgi:hypothetical protein